MLNNVYALFNRLSCRYGDVIVYPTDGFALARLKESLPQVYKLSNPFDELELCRIGSFDAETGKLYSLKDGIVRVPWNLPSAVESKASELSES